ncbi:Ejaculatory bulb-specific protein 3 [Habropoda laboriosa]|uniref:Ejaculatory bulb-specific protein 3 n=1 Tax=Habropoda laboriosa TaxID=597456 RepID=A0A0L7QTN0_9HYME|nr:PREDICTED: ejaculatory bulb-specific protein 3-like [Habropoda laboriosa]KOC61899.1 Ejaculatory bulb-specific protein 3 [Habropoda laboriosa]
MKTVLITLVSAICFLLGEEVSSEEKYTTKYDDVNIDAVLNSERLLNAYVNCLMNRGACAPDAAELKKNLPDALEHECSACSEKQKEIADKLSHYLIDHREEDWSLLEAKYDSTGAYRQRYLEDRLKETAID